MAIPSSETVSYDALLSTTLYNWQKSGGLVDQISTSNSFLYTLMKKEKEGYKSKSSIGVKAAIPLMYALTKTDSYSGYDQLRVEPMDGITAALYDWRQCATSITISGLEKKQNSGEEAMIDLLQAKTEQAVLGIHEFFAKALLQGNGINTATAITTPYTSPSNGSLFVDPLPLQISLDGTGTVGNIAAGTYTWWANQYKESAATTFAGLMLELDRLRNNCTKGPGGPPNLHLTDQSTFELYVALLRSFHQNPSYANADIPFENVLFHGKPLVWDDFMANWYGATTVQSTAQGSWVMLNTKYWQIQYDSGTNFTPTKFYDQRPFQDADAADILWLGSLLCSNRRKQGVIHKIVTTMTS